MESQTQQPVQGKKAITKKVKKAKQATSRAVAVHRPQQPAPPSNLLQVIAQATLDPRCDVAKMQALLDMQKQIEEREAKKAFTVAFNALQAELPVIDRDGKIDHGDGVTAKGNKKLKTTYATYPNLMRVLRPLLKKHGFTLSDTVKANPAGLMVVTGHLEHIGGHSRQTEFTLPADTTGGKNNQQGWGSSQQYGMRYNAIAILNISTEAKQDADNDGFPAQSSNSTISKAQTEELKILISDAKASEDKFLQAFSIDKLADLPSSDLEMAKSRIAAFKRERMRREGSDFPGDRSQ